MIAVELTSRSIDLFKTTLPEECTLVVGNEEHGIPAAVLELCQQAVHIPMFGVNGSINVTHALAIARFEWRRQRAYDSVRAGAQGTPKRVPDSVELLRADRAR